MSELAVEDPAVVAALYAPLRYRLFRLLETPRSVGELAAEIGVPADRLYYHVGKLVDAGLVRQVDTRASGRHTERIFGRTADRIRFSGDLDVGAGGGGLFRAISDELEVGIQSWGGDAESSSLSYHVVDLTEARATELGDRLRALVAEYESRPDSDPAARRFGVLGAVVPLDGGSGAHP